MDLLSNNFMIQTGTGYTGNTHVLTVLFSKPFKTMPYVNAIAVGENTHDVNIDISTVTTAGCVIHSSHPQIYVTWKAMGHRD